MGIVFRDASDGELVVVITVVDVDMVESMVESMVEVVELVIVVVVAGNK